MMIVAVRHGLQLLGQAGRQDKLGPGPGQLKGEMSSSGKFQFGSSRFLTDYLNFMLS